MSLPDNKGFTSVKDVARGIKAMFEVLKRAILPTKLYPINDANAHTPNGYALQAVTDTVIASLTATNINGAAPWDLTATTIKAGATIYVRFSAITLTSGECIVYEY